jgi:hypothetical protein
MSQTCVDTSFSFEPDLLYQPGESWTSSTNDDYLSIPFPVAPTSSPVTLTTPITSPFNIMFPSTPTTPPTDELLFSMLSTGYQVLPVGSSSSEAVTTQSNTSRYSLNPATPWPTPSTTGLPTILPPDMANHQVEKSATSPHPKKSRKRTFSSHCGTVPGLPSDAFLDVARIGGAPSWFATSSNGFRILGVEYDPVVYMTGKTHSFIRVICTRTSERQLVLKCVVSNGYDRREMYTAAPKTTTADGNMELQFTLDMASVLHQIVKGQKIAHLQFSLHASRSTEPALGNIVISD